MKLVTAALFAVVALFNAQTALANFDGHKLGNPAAPVVVEMYSEFQCSDCKAVWDTVKKVIMHYGKENIFFTLHDFPLPYHRSSFMASTAARVVEAHDATMFWKMADILMERQGEYQNKITWQKTEAQMLDQFASYAVEAGMPKEQFEQKYNDFTGSVVKSFKFGSSRGVSGTPTFFVNGVVVEEAPSWSVEKWLTVVDSLL